MWLVIKTIYSGLGVLTRGCFDFPSLSGFCIPCKPDLIWFINEVCLCFGKHSQEIYRVRARTLAPSPWVTILITGETERQLGQVYLMHKVHKVNCVITIFCLIWTPLSTAQLGVMMVILAITTIVPGPGELRNMRGIFYANRPPISLLRWSSTSLAGSHQRYHIPPR